MSWLPVSLGTFDDLKKTVSSATGLDKDMLDKLTLTTPEMNSEREQILEEETHRAKVKDMLTGMLPWETADEGREILVEDCKEAILALSSQEDTFTGPYELPPTPVKEESDDEKDKDGNDDDEDGDLYEKEPAPTGPSPESLAKLAKLEPLPPLLSNFDLDSHVGLIQRLLEIDSNLVDTQSNLSGGGDREKIFWRNYFFHCAFTRYEAGLSVDEIWSEEPRKQGDLEKAASEKGESDDAEETITFEETLATTTTTSTAATVAAATAATTATTESLAKENTGTLFDGKPVEKETIVASSTKPDLSPPSSSVGADYDFLAEEGDGGDSVMDELEAEIAEALED
eukprot:CAMPEP_0195297338 /NCGR_PEP_ID=MMETSP0707-20130614/21316_1 /TAXON_ID=33640 /ORGANISM="Asterionellopsis glacialis, Strain CCMP134" /LENGTH=341 /DNA_ID=CAMNT_0040359125 /DNA_START=274 /DNA_END=1299 /DNA_ORIENTATION=-